MSQQAVSARSGDGGADRGGAGVPQPARIGLDPEGALTGEWAARGGAHVVLTAVNAQTVIAHVTEGTADSASSRACGGPSGCAAGSSATIVWPSSSLPAIPDPSSRGISAAELAGTPLVSREGGSGTRDTLAAALAAALGPGTVQAPAALSLSTTAAVRAAVLARPRSQAAVISELAVADELAPGRLVEIQTPELDLRKGPARHLDRH